MTWIARHMQTVRVVISKYADDRVARMAAALSYYSIFSLAPLLVIAIATAGVLFGADAAKDHITSQIRSVVGDEGGSAVTTMIENGHHSEHSLLATIIGIGTLLIGATGVFGELQDSMNTIWRVQAKPGHGLWHFIADRLLSFAMVFGIGFLLVVSLLLSAGLSAVTGFFSGSGDSWVGVAHVAESSISFLVIGLLFAASYKLLPDVSVRWRDVWFGASIASVLFILGKFAIGLYLGKSAIASTYGSMGSLAVLLVWIYYSSQIFLIGAEFTRAHAIIDKAELTPIRGAEWIPGQDPEKQREQASPS